MDKPKLTRKQKAFADELLKNPKISATQSAIKHYGKPDKPITYETARNVASENLSKPNIVEYLKLHQKDAENTVIKVMNYSNNRLDKIQYARLALDSANSVLDRTIGKATVADNSTNLTQINIQLGK